MLGIVKDNKIIPLTTDTGTGAPVGTLIQQYKKKPMSGYLYCDGSTFDQNAYPALYMYLGTNVLPDYTGNVNEYTYIKATSGLMENQQENVLNDVKDYVDNSNSYSTEEVKTGGTWIDGKPIYRKTWIGKNDVIGWNTIASLSDLNILKVTKAEQIYENSEYIQGNYFSSSDDRYRFFIRKSDMTLVIDAYINSEYVITLYYTKTTD